MKKLLIGLLIGLVLAPAVVQAQGSTRCQRTKHMLDHAGWDAFLEVKSCYDGTDVAVEWDHGITIQNSERWRLVSEGLGESDDVGGSTRAYTVELKFCRTKCKTVLASVNGAVYGHIAYFGSVVPGLRNDVPSKAEHQSCPSTGCE